MANGFRILIFEFRLFLRWERGHPFAQGRLWPPVPYSLFPVPYSVRLPFDLPFSARPRSHS
jgi:hypothetical protein